MTQADDRVRLERVVNTLMDELETTQRNVASLKRAQDSQHTTIHPGGVYQFELDDGSRLSIGSNESGKAIEHVGGPTPEQPEAPEVDTQEGTLAVVVDGFDVHGEPAPADLKHTIVHYSRDEQYTPGPATNKGVITGATGQKVFSLSAGLWYVAVQWVTESGKLSEPSEIVAVDIDPPVNAQDIQDTLDAAEQKLNTYRDEVAAPRFQAIETGLSENNDNLENARDRLAEAESTLAPLPGRVESAEQDVAAAQVEATKAAAAAVEANNRAMTRLANGNFESDLLYWDHDNVELTSTAHSGQQAAQVSGWLRPGSSFPVVPDQIWELSLYHQYDVTVELQAIDGDTRTVLSTHHLDGDSTWSDSGALRVTIPADVHMLSFTITGTSAIVDDITLRDVTDVVRLEEAANANRQKAEQAISELAVMRLAVDGEGGLKDRLDSAENDLENIDTELDQVATNLTTALTGPVDHTRLRAGEGAFDTGFIGELWAGNIRALAAELARATIAAPNLWPDPDFEQDVYGSWTRVDGGIERNGSESLSVSYVSDDNFYIPIEYDVPYRITVDFSLNGPGRGEVWLRDADANKTYIGSTARSNFRSSSGTFNITYMPSSNSNGQARYMYLGFGTRNTDPSTRLRFENLKIERMTDGSLIVENSVTAEKITATRELITKIMGAEWAYIAQQLIVDGSILTRDLEALSAAIQSLTVTQRADIAQLWAEELWAALAVIEELQAEEAWITSAMISELTAEKVTVTEEFVARVASFIEVFADKFWANTAFIDRMAASEAHFGSEDADQATRVDGQGVTAYRRDEMGELIPAIQFGGGEFGINWYDETTGEPTGGITNEGNITGRSFQAAHYSLGGRPIFGNPENYAGEGPILETLPKGEVALGYRNMGGQSRTDRSHWGFLELTPFEAEPGRAYHVTLQPFRMGDTKNYFVSFRYTTDGTSPNWSSPQAALFTQAGNTFSGSFRFVPDTPGLVRMIIFVYTGSTGITFSTSGSEVTAFVTDAGPAIQGVGFTRNATNINPDDQPLVREYTSGWPMGWYQNYSNGIPGYEANNYLMQGIVGGTNLVNSLWGGYTTRSAIHGETGRTMNQVLTNDAVLHGGFVTLRGRATGAINNGFLQLHWHTHSTAPATFPIEPWPANFIESQQVRHGEVVRYELPPDCLAAIENGEDIGFSLHPRDRRDPYFATSASLNASGPVLTLNYTR